MPGSTLGGRTIPPMKRRCSRGKPLAPTLHHTEFMRLSLGRRARWQWGATALLLLLFPGDASARPESPHVSAALPAPVRIIAAPSTNTHAAAHANEPRLDVRAPARTGPNSRSQRIASSLTVSSRTVLPIMHGDHELGQPLDRAAIRSSDDFLSDGTFDRKWSAALESPLLFFRSFPSAYYRDLRGIAARGVPGGQGIILGDPHPENFGFVKSPGGTEFVFNDFDDSGRGPVAIDALRYFTALRLAYPDKPHVFAKTLDAYVEAVRHATIVLPPISVQPQWSDIRAENLRKFTSGDGFVSNERNRLSPASSKTTALVRSLVEKDERFGSARVLDVAHRERDYGGSGGLQRIWVLTERKGESPRILELKEEGPPATDALVGETLRPSNRIATLKRAFLTHPPSDDLFTVDLVGTRFLVRDRSHMASVPIEELSKEDRNDLLRAQVSVMGNVHRTGWAGVDEQAMRQWLDGSSDTLAGRWIKAFEKAKQ